MMRICDYITIFLGFVFICTPQPALAKVVTQEAVGVALEAGSETCLRNEWMASLERQFESDLESPLFLEAHLANGFLCRDTNDIRQFLLLLGVREFPSHLAKHMTVSRAKILAQEERALQETQTGVRIAAPQDPSQCVVEVEGVRLEIGVEMRSLPGRSLHVRYLCGNRIYRHIIFVSPAASAIRLPKIAEGLSSELGTEKADKENVDDSVTLYRAAKYCSTGFVLAINASRLGMGGVNNTEFPLFAELACSTFPWRLAVAMGEVEILGSKQRRAAQNKILFIAGEAQREVAHYEIGNVRVELGVGVGFWAASEVVSPVVARLGVARKSLGAWTVSASVAAGVALQNGSKNLWLVGLSVGTAP